MPTPVRTCMCCEITSARFTHFATVRGWNYVTCRKCSFVFLDPQPTLDELRSYYASQYPYDPAAYKNSIERQSVCLDYLEGALGAPGTLLEIGCSYGYFLDLARRHGWSTRGVEPGRAAADFAVQKLGLEVVNGTVADMANDHARFDVIVAWHVLEHDSNPREFLRICTQLLKPGGLLGLRVPNIESTVSRLAGKTWQWLSPPEHVCMYSKSTLLRLLRDFSFETITCTSARGNARNIWFEVARARTKNLLNGKLGREPSSSMAASFQPPPRYDNRVWYRAAEQLVGLASWPVEVVARPRRERIGKEAELVVFARKPAGNLQGASA